MADLAQVTLEGIQSFGTAARFTLADRRLAHSRRRGRILVVMFDDVAARFAQTV